MNIFYLDKDPRKAAEYHCDKHVVKMILETAQLLSTAHHCLDDYVLEGIYESTHKNHPCSVWARASLGNYRWLWRLGVSLCEEYTYRWNKPHSVRKMYDRLFLSPILHGSFYDPPQCVSDECKKQDTVDSYRHYYENYKAHLLVYTKRQFPEWMVHEPKIIDVFA